VLPPPWPQVYKRVVDKPITERRLAGICQRENDFYVGAKHRWPSIHQNLCFPQSKPVLSRMTKHLLHIC
jgi:hypothetical protein